MFKVQCSNLNVLKSNVERSTFHVQRNKGEMLRSIAPFSFKKFGVIKVPELQYHEKHSANITKKTECTNFFYFKPLSAKNHGNSLDSLGNKSYICMDNS
jgi:hypothetical protein